MAQINESIVTLRIMGDELIPSEITSILGCKPTSSQKKGQEFIGSKTGKKRVARIGMWRLEAGDQKPENVEAQIYEIIDKLSPELNVWQSLAKKYQIDLFCGLFMKGSNEGMEIPAGALKALGDRGVMLSLDIYDGDDDIPSDDEPCPCKSGKTYKECCKKGA